MFNRWSLYQALSCRMWARSALYQSGGAYGFRDQLQDCMAFVYAEPAIARAHLLRAAGRQFLEGDVQHWWHEPSGRGVRTRFSDDLAWLPFVADHYVRVTGDVAVWDARAPYLDMRTLGADEQEAYDLPDRERRDRHALRALRPRDRARVHRGRARTAAHRRRRLERRNEPRRRAGQGRERLARLVLDGDVARVRRARRVARRCETAARCACARRCIRGRR